MDINELEKYLENLPKGQLSPAKDAIIEAQIKREAHEMEQSREKLAWFTFGWAFKRFAVGLCAVVILFSGIGAYAYSSDNVTIDKKLYGVKAGIENYRLRKATDSYSKTEVHSDLAQRRLSEAEILAQRNGQSLAAYLIPAAHAASVEQSINSPLLLTIENYTFHNKSALDYAQKIEDIKKLQTILILLDGREHENKQRVETIAKKVGIKAPEPLVDTIVVALEETKLASTNVNKAIGQVNMVLATSRRENPTVVMPTPIRIELTPRVININWQIVETGQTQPVDNYKKELELFTAQLKTQPSTPEVETYINRLEQKVKATDEALKQGNVQRLRIIIRSGKALKESASVYIRTSPIKVQTESARPTIETQELPTTNQIEPEKYEIKIPNTETRESINIEDSSKSQELPTAGVNSEPSTEPEKEPESNNNTEQTTTPEVNLETNNSSSKNIEPSGSTIGVPAESATRQPEETIDLNTQNIVNSEAIRLEDNSPEPYNSRTINIQLLRRFK